MWGGNIRRRVLASVEERIASGQKEYDDKSKSIDETTAEAIRAVTASATTEKEQLENAIINRILA